MRLNIPRSTEEAVLMNERKNEKKRLLKLARKPTCDSEWLQLAEHMRSWVRDNPVKNIHSYSRQFGYAPSTLKLWRKESDIFRQAYEYCIITILERREAYLEERNQLGPQYLKELPLYNPDYAEYEMKKLKQEKSILGSSTPIQLYQPLYQSIKDTEKK